MVYPLPANQEYYRATTVGRKWRDVLSGKGSLFLSPAGNRYNVVVQRAAYISDSLEAAVTEWAYYSAKDWMKRLGNHHILPVPSPMQDTYVLWRFTLTQPTHVIDVEAGSPLPVQMPLFALQNPGNYYAMTQWVANNAIATPVAGHAAPQPGLKVPAVRSRQNAAAIDSNYVLYRFAGTPRGQQTGRWRLLIEFLDINGNAVTGGSPRVDWAHPRFQLIPSPGGAGPVPRAAYALNTWYTLTINFL